jgi:hypothetical protein
MSRFYACFCFHAKAEALLPVCGSMKSRVRSSSDRWNGHALRGVPVIRCLSSVVCGLHETSVVVVPAVVDRLQRERLDSHFSPFS